MNKRELMQAWADHMDMDHMESALVMVQAFIEHTGGSIEDLQDAIAEAIETKEAGY